MAALDTTGLVKELDVDGMLRAASEEARLEDFGPEPFGPPLERFVHGVATEGRINEIGLMLVKGDIHRFLVNRLRFQDDLKRHPEILDENVSDPIVITGLPRTGTSKVHRMMSSAANVQKLLFWRLLNPAPIPGSVSGDVDPRIAAAEQLTDMLGNFPDFQAAHPTQFDEVDEDLLLYEFTFETVVATFRFRMPSYLEQILNAPLRHTYDYVKSILQYLQWQDGGKRDRPWILKTPVHLDHLDLVMQTYPNATVVHCHRDPTEVIPSFARTVEATRGLGSDDIDAGELGDEQLRIWSGAMARNLELRDELGQRLSIVDLQYALIKNDPIAAITQVYEAAGRRFSPADATRMQEWAAANPQYRFGHHRYSLEVFGLTEERVHMAFSDYEDRFKAFIGPA